MMKTKKIWKILGICIGIAAIIGVTFVRFIPSITNYELVSIVLLVFVCGWKLVIPVAKGRFDRFCMLECLCWLACIVAIYSTLTQGQTEIHSDIATASLLSKSQAKYHSIFPVSWNYGNGEIWVLSINTFVFPFCLIMKNQVLARLLGSVVFILLAVLAVRWVGSTLGHKMYLIAIPVLFVSLRGAYDIILYQAAYTGPIIWILICPLLLYRAMIADEKINVKYMVFYSILTCLLCMSGTRNFAELVLPLFGGMILLLYMDIREKDKICWQVLIRKICTKGSLIVAPAILGFGIYKWLCSWHNVNNTYRNALELADSVQEVMENFRKMIENLLLAFGYDGGQPALSSGTICSMISVIFCVMFIYVVPILQARKIKSENLFFQFYFWFAMVHNAIMMILVVFFGKLEERYLYTTVFTFLFISSHYIMKYWIEHKNFRKHIYCVLFSGAVMIEMMCMANISLGWTTRLTERRQISVEIEERGLTKGYATYWNAYANELYSDMRISFGAVEFIEETIEPYDWLVDNKVYEKTDGESFLMLTDYEIENENQAAVEKVKECCIDQFRVGDEYTVYVFDYDIQGRME